MSRRLRRSAAAFVLPLALATLVACGSDPAEEEAGSSAAADPGLEAGEEMAVEDFVSLLEDAVSGESTARISIVSDDPGSPGLEGDIDYSVTPPSSRLTSQDDSGSGEVEVIQVGTATYVRSSEQGAKFLKSETPDVDGLSGGVGLDPAASLDTLRKGLESVTYQGADEVDGEEMVRYTLLVDSGELMDADLAELADLPAETTYDVWFDRQGRYRQMVTELMGEAEGQVTLRLSEWGQDVSIEAPADDEVFELPAIPDLPEVPEIPELPEMPTIPSVSPAPQG